MNNQLAIALTEIIANAIIYKHSYAYTFDGEDAEKIHKHLKAAMSSHSMIEITESIVAKHNLVNRLPQTHSDCAEIYKKQDECKWPTLLHKSIMIPLRRLDNCDCAEIYKKQDECKWPTLLHKSIMIPLRRLDNCDSILADAEQIYNEFLWEELYDRATEEVRNYYEEENMEFDLEDEDVCDAIYDTVHDLTTYNPGFANLLADLINTVIRDQDFINRLMDMIVIETTRAHSRVGAAAGNQLEWMTIDRQLKQNYEDGKQLHYDYLKSRNQAHMIGHFRERFYTTQFS